MRIRLRWVLVLVFLAVFASRASWQRIWNHAADRLARKKDTDALVVSHTYLLEHARWLEFQLPPASQMAWVLTNANFHPQSPVSTNATTSRSDRPGAVYAIEYQIVDSKGNALRTGTYHFRSQPPDPNIGPGSRAFYASVNLLPAAGQSMRLSLTRYCGRACRLRLRQMAIDSAIGDVSARVYYRDEIPDYKLTHAWQRTSTRAQEQLCRASVYGPDLLTDFEKRNLIKRRWRPLASLGIDGRDYHRRILYSPLRPAPEDDGPCELPAGLSVNRQSKGVIPLPAGHGKVRLIFARVPDAEPAEVVIRWHGGADEEIEQWHLTLSESSQELEIESGTGMLVIESTQEVVTSAWWEDLESEMDAVDITPTRAAVRMYLVNSSNAVEYATEHVAQLPTPLKLTVRAPLITVEKGECGLSPPRFLLWSFIDTNGTVIESGQLDIDRAVSLYDRTSDSHPHTFVTEPTIYYFAVPAGVSTVRLTSNNGDVLVNACSRPPDVAKTTLVPSGYSAFQRANTLSRGWFAIRPTENLKRINQFQTVTVLIQPRPNSVSQQLLAGNFHWQSYLPLGSWKARQLLVPREIERPIRWEALHSAYYPMQLGTDQIVSLRTVPGHRSVSPRLVCQSTTDRALLRVFINGTLHQEVTLRRGCREFQLDALSVESGQPSRIRLETNADVCVFMNCIDSAETNVLLKRMAFRFEGHTLRFEYKKESHDKEVLSLTLFHASSAQQARLRARILGSAKRDIGPHNDWTIIDRIYDVESIGAVPALLLRSNTSNLLEHSPCFIKLGGDLPPGTYMIEVSREDDHEGYVLLSRTIPGLIERRKMATDAQPMVSADTPLPRNAYELP